jgi:two-component system chemotaxis sensor kinase CheA
VNRLVRFGQTELARLQGQDVLRLGAAPLPVFSLAETLGLASRAPRRESEQALGMVLTTGGREAVFVVDDLLAEQELVIKNLGPRIRRLRHVSGATLLPSGRIALVLSAANLIRDALGRGTSPGARTFATDAPAAKKRLLTVDDSVTTRNLLRIILEAAGYEVTVAVDGQDAWQKLQADEFDLIVSDIEMPRLDGFELTRRLRGGSRFAGLPIVLVTGRETDEDKLRGIEAGASAYLVKSAFDQRNLLETIAQLL